MLLQYIGTIYNNETETVNNEIKSYYMLLINSKYIYIYTLYKLYLYILHNKCKITEYLFVTWSNYGYNTSQVLIH